ncbi:MAG TPA: bacillithiol biosynthesis BshC, partial [Planctomycetota bacterium]|nr:bacillithiol biosynthesis BshC [Planctomycetota bacterium]
SFDGPRRVAGPSAGRLSAGVAMRLIVQDAVLPTALVIAGPHELAYIAQLTELYEAFGRTGPVVAPRITATLVDPKADRLASAIGISGAQLLAREDTIRFGAALEATADIQKSLQALADEIIARMKAVETGLGAGQKDLARKTTEKITSVVAAFSQRIAAAQKEADTVASERAKKLVAHLTPGGQLQERVLSVWYFRSVAGPDLVQKLMSDLDPFCPDHQLAWL